MRQLVGLAVVGALIVAAMAVGFMGAIGLKLGDGEATTVLSNLNTIGLIVVSCVASIVSHYIGAASAAGDNGTGGPPPAAVTPAQPQAPSTPAGP